MVLYPDGDKEEEEEDEFEEIVYSLEDDKRMNLEYYKNNILNYFLPISFVATSILSNNNDMIPLTQIMEDYRFFKKLFLREFIFDQTKDDLDEVNEVLAYLHNQGMIVGEERNEQAWIEVKGKGRTHLKPFAGLISNYIESYWVVIRGCSYLQKGPLQKKDLIKKVQGLGAKMYRKGEIRRSEALSQSSFENALRVFQESDILQLTETGEKGEKSSSKLMPWRTTDLPKKPCAVACSNFCNRIPKHTQRMLYRADRPR